jgi:tetratricopeptide (TPR) repeat protein
MMAYQESAQLTALEDAIALYDQALQLRPQETEDRAVSLSDLGNALWEFCQLHERDKVRLDRAVLLLREALHLRPLGHEARDSALNSLARALWVSFEQFGDAEKVKEATSLHREALQLRPRGHPARIQTLGNLANVLMEADETQGRTESLDEALGLLREALNILPLGHPLRDRVLNNLGCCLRLSFEHHGRPDLLAEAIVMDREALQLRPLGHPLRDTSLDNLAESLFISFKRQGDLDVLSEVITLNREALSLRGLSHPLRANILSSLADALRLECHFRPQPNALDEPIALLREAVRVSATGHIFHDQFLVNLADALQAEHNQNGCIESLSEAVDLYRKALQFQTPGHYLRHDTLCGLGVLLCQPSLRAWPEALAMFQEALESCPKVHPSRARLLCGASACYFVPDSPYFDFSQGIAHLSQALDDDYSPVRERLSLVIPKLELLETALSATTVDPEASVQLTVNILRTYRQAIGLLPRAANLGLHYHARLQAVAGSDGISRDGAAWALRLDRVSEAVEMLEEGRGVFWGQALRLRAPGLDKVPADDRAELERLFSLLEQSESTSTLKEAQLSVMQREAKAENRRRWNEKAEAVISRIRTYPGLARFLLPGPGSFDTLMQSLPHGFVVVLNASKLGCHALLLDGTTGLATSMEIKPFRGGFDVGAITAQLPRDIGFETSAAQSFRHDNTRAMRRVSAAGDLDRFERTLADLWTQIAQPIISKLKLMVSVDDA